VTYLLTGGCFGRVFQSKKNWHWTSTVRLRPQVFESRCFVRLVAVAQLQLFIEEQLYKLSKPLFSMHAAIVIN